MQYLVLTWGPSAPAVGHACHNGFSPHRHPLCPALSDKSAGCACIVAQEAGNTSSHSPPIRMGRMWLGRLITVGATATPKADRFTLPEGNVAVAGFGGSPDRGKRSHNDRARARTDRRP